MDKKWLYEIKNNNYKPIYFFYGSSRFLIEETVLWIKGFFDDIDIHIIDLELDTFNEFAKHANTFSLFNSQRLVIAKNIDCLNKIDNELLLRLLENPPKDNIVVMISNEKELDNRKKLTKTLKDSPHIELIHFANYKIYELKKWIVSRLKKYEFKIEEEALQELITLTNYDMFSIDKEIVKMITYFSSDYNKKSIISTDVHNLVFRSNETDIFKFIDEIFKKRFQNVLALWQNFLDQKIEPIFVLSMIIRQLRLILKTQIYLNQEKTLEDISRKLKSHVYPIKLSADYGKIWSMDEIQILLSKALTLEQEFKTGLLQNKISSLECFIYEFRSEL